MIEGVELAAVAAVVANWLMGGDLPVQFKVEAFKCFDQFGVAANGQNVLDQYLIHDCGL